ncbi:MAG: N-acetylmuramoyl-L-alanine amidase [Prolixibacteraceae bacterium]|nr:N-acetylmuramoyl-L-alanine amidase [Prolixibacteraceae bacterium]
MNNLNYSKPLLALIFCLFIAVNSHSIASANKSTKQLVVVIDPGHGGKDPGAVNRSIREKDIVLGIGLKLGKLINENHPDVKVIYTRSTDVFVPLIERSRIANKNKADLFISLHANACSTPATRGTETFFLGPSRSDDNLEVAKKENSVILLEEDYKETYEGFDPNSAESYIMFELMQNTYLDLSLFLADAIQQQFRSKIESPNRGVKQAGFLVLRQSSMPSVLVEAGFLSNTNEANYLNSDSGQRNVALSIVEAFRKFKDKTTGSSNTKSPVITAKNEKKQEVAQQEVRAENKTKAEVIAQAVTEEKNIPEKEKTINTPDTTAKVKATENSIYYSVQIGANTTPIDPVASNFKGLKNVRREKTDKYYRYYLGNESTIEKISVELKQIKQKFPQAFIVSFVNGQRVPLN